MAADHGHISLQIYSKPKIQKVPFMLANKENLRKFFEPKVVYFGPIHHGMKSPYKKADALKEDWKNKFFKNTGQSEEFLLGRIENDIQQLRSCFEDDVFDGDDKASASDDKALARMLLVDGCAVLHVIYCFVEKDCRELNVNLIIALFLMHDVLLLENQVPFRLLDLLIRPVDHEKKWTKMIKKFICERPITLEMQKERKLSIDADDEDQKPTHLLELLRESLLLGTTNAEEEEEKQGQCCWDIKGKKKERDYGLFRSVTELKESGIDFMKKQSRYLNDFSFTRSWISGILEIPPVRVDDSTGPSFMNLIAYEMCPDFHNNFEVSTYVCFLDTLIDCARDVKELRKAHIVRNHLGSDEEVAKLFNEISTDLMENTDLFGELMKEIQCHNDTKWKTNMAKLLSSHFKYPWSIIASIAALIVFALTVVQFSCNFYNCKRA